VGHLDLVLPVVGWGGWGAMCGGALASARRAARAARSSAREVARTARARAPG
jgi:hypothetical protein